MTKYTSLRSDLCPVWSRVKHKGEGKMYGILLESVQCYVSQQVGQAVWKQILEHAGIKDQVFTCHNLYKDEYMTSLAISCCHVTKTKDFNQWMYFFGSCFVKFCSSYGYDSLLRVSGRNFRDFLHGIDNIHETIRFSYPRLKSPSFLVISEDKEGCVLLYQSSRHGFKHYVMGQLTECANMFYKVSVKVTLVEEKILDNKTCVRLRLDFDNSVFVPKLEPKPTSGKEEFSGITSDHFFKVFPFCIVFNSLLTITHAGDSITLLLKGDTLIGHSLRDKFNIRRPLIPCIWSKILQFQTVIFELEYVFHNDLLDLNNDCDDVVKEDLPSKTNQVQQSRVLLRGEMKYIQQWDMIAFLCSPLFNGCEDLSKLGLFINDLNMFDNSRDLVMAETQYASQLERSLEQQSDKSEQIKKNLDKAEEWKIHSDNLLYSMIPKSIAERLKSGETPIKSCEVLDDVTILFNYMVGFAEICATAEPLDIVRCINSTFSLFDKIIDKYDVFKVETLGDAVYMVAGGVPDKDPNHAINVAGLALDILTEAKTILDPIGKNLEARIGMHTGSVVGGVIGHRMPQYCLFGDAVNVAARMQTYSQPGRIHLSEPCQQCLKGSNLVTVVRGTVNIKGKGDMKTYWLAGREGEERTEQFCEDIRRERSHNAQKHSSYDNALDLHAMHACTSFNQLDAHFDSLKVDQPNRSRQLHPSNVVESQTIPTSKPQNYNAEELSEYSTEMVVPTLNVEDIKPAIKQRESNDTLLHVDKDHMGKKIDSDIMKNNVKTSTYQNKSKEQNEVSEDCSKTIMQPRCLNMQQENNKLVRVNQNLVNELTHVGSKESNAQDTSKHESPKIGINHTGIHETSKEHVMSLNIYTNEDGVKNEANPSNIFNVADSKSDAYKVNEFAKQTSVDDKKELNTLSKKQNVRVQRIHFSDNECCKEINVNKPNHATSESNSVPRALCNNSIPYPKGISPELTYSTTNDSKCDSTNDVDFSSKSKCDHNTHNGCSINLLRSQPTQESVLTNGFAHSENDISNDSSLTNGHVNYIEKSHNGVCSEDDDTPLGTGTNNAKSVMLQLLS